MNFVINYKNSIHLTMAIANLRVLKAFIQTIDIVSGDRDIHYDLLKNKSAFTRSGKLGFNTVTYLILSMLTKSLQVELYNYFTTLDVLSGLRFTKGAFSQRRHQIDSKWFRFLISHFAALFYDLSESVSLWKGYKLLAIDGSSAILLNNEELNNQYKGGQNKYGTYPLCRYMKMYDVLNEITLKVEMMPMKGSERKCAYQWVDAIPDGSITIFDRGFPSFTLFYLMLSCERPKDFIIRCKQKFSSSIKDFVTSVETSSKIKFYPDDRAISTLRQYHYKVTRQTFVELRVEKIVLENNEVEVLITSIDDELLLSNSEMKELYHKRWAIETNIGKEKNVLQLENFSSHLKNGIEQDFYATFITGNIHSLLCKEAQQRIDQKVSKRKYRYKINASASMNTFKKNLIRLFYTRDLYQLIVQIQSVFELFIEPVRPNRKVQRMRVSKRRYGKHQTHKNYRNNF